MINLLDDYSSDVGLLGVDFTVMRSAFERLYTDNIVSITAEGASKPHIENKPCHLSIVEHSEPRINYSQSGGVVDIKSAKIAYGRVSFKHDVYMNRGDTVVIDKLDPTDNTLLARYKGVVGYPTVTQSRKVSEFEITSVEQGTPPAPEKYYPAELYVLDMEGNTEYASGFTAAYNDGILKFGDGFTEKDGKLIYSRYDGEQVYPIGSYSNIKVLTVPAVEYVPLQEPVKGSDGVWAAPATTLVAQAGASLLVQNVDTLAREYAPFDDGWGNVEDFYYYGSLDLVNNPKALLQGINYNNRTPFKRSVLPSWGMDEYGNPASETVTIKENDVFRFLDGENFTYYKVGACTITDGFVLDVYGSPVTQQSMTFDFVPTTDPLA